MFRQTVVPIRINNTGCIEVHRMVATDIFEVLRHFVILCWYFDVALGFVCSLISGCLVGSGVSLVILGP